MITAKEASEKLANMTPAERLEALKNRVSESTRNALDAKIREVIASYGRKVDVTLRASICRDPDADIRGLLLWLWYEDIHVTSDFPAYNESYEGSTTIRFSIPGSVDPLPPNYRGYGD